MEKIDCILILKHGNPFIYKVKYKGIYYTINTQGFKYTTKVGGFMYYIFGVASRSIFFKIKINLNTLNCYLINTQIME